MKGIAPVAEVQDEGVRSRTARFREETIDRSGGILSYADVATRLGSGTAPIEKQHRYRRLLGVPYQGETGFPAAQFVENEILPGLDSILSTLGDMNPWEQLMLLTTPLEGYGPCPETVFQILARSPDSRTMQQLIALLSGWAS